MGKYDELVDNIIPNLGGNENISHSTHCVTRLRFNVKDKSAVNDSYISNIDSVLGTNWSGEQYQVIVGQNAGDIYSKIENKLEMTSTENSNSNREKNNNESKIKSIFIKVIDTISSAITPVLPVLIGGGLLKVILLLLTITGLLTEQSSTYQVLTFASNAAFYFLPVYVGAASARIFGLNIYLGMFFGAVLLDPTFVDFVANETVLTIFGLPIYPANYDSSIFPILLTTLFASYISRFSKKIAPSFLEAMLVPLITIIITLPVMLVVLGPLGGILGEYLAAAVTWLYDSTGVLGIAIFGALTPWLVITGMHHSFNPYTFQSLATLGYEPLVLVVTFINNLNQGAAALAVSLKSKKEKTKSTALTAGLTALVAGITEPVLYGINLKYRTPLYAVMIGNVAGSIVAGLFNVVIYAFAGSWGVFGLAAFIDESNNLMYMIISVIVGMIITFISTLILYKPELETKIEEGRI